MKLLRINTADRTYSFDDLGEYKELGGRALTSKIVLKEVPADCNPLAGENKLVAAGGTLTGTVAANSGRISVGAKSPLTGGIKESNSGGTFPQKLSKLGIAALVLEGRPEERKFMTIRLFPDKVEFDDADDIFGLGTYDSMDKMREKYGEKVSGMLIGPAGEEMLKAASIQFSDPDGRPARAAGRGGMGAVMGSKGVKAIVIEEQKTPVIKPVDAEKFKTANKRWVEILKNHPVTGQGLPGFGTAVLVNVINEAGALPTKNFRDGRFDKAAEISGEKIAENIKARGGVNTEGCHPGCVIQCSQQYVDENGKYISSGFEYETIWAFGANSLVSNIDDIARLDRACDDVGLDTIETGTSVAVAMDGGCIPWGDSKAALGLLEEVAKKTPLGRILGNGTQSMADAYGVERVPVVKNQSLPAYDPRAVKGVGVTYATTTQGADHTAGYAVAPNILKVGGDVDPLSPEGQVEVSKNLQVATATLDSLGLCLFVAFAVLDTEDAVACICDLVSAARGIEFEPADFLALGAQTLVDEIEFNNLAGFGPKDDQLPRFFSTEKLDPHGVTWTFTQEELQAAKDLDGLLKK